MGRAIAAGLLLAVVAFAAMMVWALHDISVSSVLDPSSKPVILLEAADGTELARRGPFRAPPAAREDIPQNLVHAVLAIEDRRFYRHSGVDLLGILRALGSNLIAGKVVEGGSTITQQLVKLRSRENERTIRRKIREAVLAFLVERRLSKGEILTHYLNSVYLGAGATGISAAARVYFDKPVAELTLEESALIAGLISAPSQLNPLEYPEAAQDRAAVVLDAMVAGGIIDKLRAETAKSRPARLKPARIPSSAGTWFADWAHGEAAEIASSFKASRAGAVRVRTTLVPELQAVAENVISSTLDDHGEKSNATQAALVAMRPNGAVLAMVGGRNYGESQFNRAVQAERQPGSTFKLFVYYAALRNGLSLQDTIDDTPVEIDGWEPENFGERYYGTVALGDAFAHSLNAATVRLAQEIGIDEVIEAARNLGIDAPLAPNPSLALGTSEVSLLDLTGAFASIRAGIAPIEPRAIAGFGALDQQRLLVPGPPAEPRQSLAPYREQLVGLLKRVVDDGTGRAASLPGFAAGKTGTSESYRDAWFVGFNENLVVGVWVGNDNGEPMNEVTGGKLPALIWKAFMSEAATMELPEAPPLAAADDLLAGEFESDEPVAEQGSAADGPSGPLFGAKDQTVIADDLMAGGLDSGEPADGIATDGGFRCNYEACDRAYRSFRASDCTYQPYRGPRKLCLRGAADALSAGALGDAEGEVTEQGSTADELIDAFGEVISGPQDRCNYDACDRAYRSFRASDCTYQPYRGRRKQCPL